MLYRTGATGVAVCRVDFVVDGSGEGNEGELGEEGGKSQGGREGRQGDSVRWLVSI